MGEAKSRSTRVALTLVSHSGGYFSVAIDADREMDEEKFLAAAHTCIFRALCVVAEKLRDGGSLDDRRAAVWADVAEIEQRLKFHLGAWHTTETRPSEAGTC